jgi:NTE family protein
MLEALYERGIVPDVLVATSVGALNAAFIASRAQTVATARALARVWRDLQREDVFPVSLSALVGGVCGRRDHLVSDHGLRRLITRYLEFDDLAEAPIPLHLVAFDLAEGREVLVSRGAALESVIAAASIPGVFPPVRKPRRTRADRRPRLAGSTSRARPSFPSRTCPPRSPESRSRNDLKLEGAKHDDLPR